MNRKNIAFVTLGCSKNDVDTDIMSNILNGDKYQLTHDVDEANIIVVNTCGFIESAKQESIDTIFELIDARGENYEHLILSGCLAQRYPEDLMEAIPEVSGVLGTGQIGNINEFLDEVYDGNRVIKIENIDSEHREGVYKTDVSTTEYVKISEGCNNNCTYCIIPQLRGKHRSRKMEDIYSEVKHLVDNGAKEIILIAQNTSDYGEDLYGKYNLHELLKKLSEIENLKWIRVMYLYPDNFNDELINEFAHNEKLLPYVDIPLQHVSDNVLKRMNRGTKKSDIVALIEKLRVRVPNMVIRTTFIVGFPGETEEDFEELKDFIGKYQFDKLGAFTYSKEEGTPAYKLDGQIEEEVKKERLDELLAVQREISEEICAGYVGNEYEAIIEEYVDDENYVGRIYADAPEIDGVVYINSKVPHEIGDIVRVAINDSLEYDIIGEYIDEFTK